MRRWLAKSLKAGWAFKNVSTRRQWLLTLRVSRAQRTGPRGARKLGAPRLHYSHGSLFLCKIKRVVIKNLWNPVIWDSFFFFFARAWRVLLIWLIPEATGETSKWRRSPSTTCFWIQQIWTSFYVIWGSRIFRSVRLSRTTHPSLKVQRIPRFHITTKCLCIVPSNSGQCCSDFLRSAGFKGNHLCPKEQLPEAFLASVRITHMAQVLHEANVFCCMLVWHICCHCAIVQPVSSEQSWHPTLHDLTGKYSSANFTFVWRKLVLFEWHK